MRARNPAQLLRFQLRCLAPTLVTRFVLLLSYTSHSLYITLMRPELLPRDSFESEGENNFERSCTCMELVS